LGGRGKWVDGKKEGDQSTRVFISSETMGMRGVVVYDSKRRELPFPTGQKTSPKSIKKEGIFPCKKAGSNRSTRKPL